MHNEFKIIHHVIKFDNPVFHEGLNVTIRLGLDWHDRVKIGDYLHVLDTNAKTENVEFLNDLIVGTVAFVMTVRWRDLPECLLQFEHDEKCQTKEGLRRVLMDAYDELRMPGRVLEETNAILTVIGFYVFRRA